MRNVVIHVIAALFARGMDIMNGDQLSGIRRETLLYSFVIATLTDTSVIYSRAPESFFYSRT